MEGEQMDHALLERKLGIEFIDKEILKQAFIHSSYVNEQQLHQTDDNERLEFLGDAVLELAVSNFLYDKVPLLVEGDMTKVRAFLVCEATLCSVAEQLDLGAYLLLGKGEERTGGRNRPSILADVFEAFLGALYVDQGFERVCTFLAEFLYVHASTPQFSSGMDYKTTLQEHVQQEQGAQVTYTIIEESGPAHDREFVAQAEIKGHVTTKGRGKSKKEAEQRAAQKVLATLSKK